ncbi:MAG: flotillin-like FloA family protein [Phycisphaerae bacterium]|nr:flotillin-like FloA family protein [Phycisphaerae bacterium]
MTVSSILSQTSIGDYITWGVWAVVIVLLLVVAMVVLAFGRLWIKARFSGAPVGFGSLVGMMLRKVNASLIVDARISAVQAGILDLSTQDLESIYLVRRQPNDVRICVSSMITAHKANIPFTIGDLQGHLFAGGNVTSVVTAMVEANRAKIHLDFDAARAIDLAGRDILDAIHTSVNPKVIDCPLAQTGTDSRLDAVAKDGIRLLIKARVTIRTCLERLVGGATEETIIARVGQGIVSAVGSSPTYKDVLENPDAISRRVLDLGLDAATAFEIVSVDIADVSVAGVADKANVGAFLDTERALADKQQRQAEAEGRRAMAVAREAEMTAAVEENRAKLVLAESEVPRAMADAFRSGNLGIMDYYRMRNIQSDTTMRDAISKGDRETGHGTGDEPKP